MWILFLIFEIPLLLILDNTVGNWDDEVLAWIVIGIIHVIYYACLFWVMSKSSKSKCKYCGEKVSMNIEEYFVEESIIRKEVEKVKKVDLRNTRLDNHDRYVGTIKESVMADFKRVKKKVVYKCPLCEKVDSEQFHYEEYEV